MSSCSEEWSFVVDKEKRSRMVTFETTTPLEKLKMIVLVINSQRLKLTWGRSHVPKHGQDGWKYQQGSVAQSVLLTPPMQQQYYMHPTPPNHDKPYYPSMDPQRMGGSSTSENNRAYMMPPRQP
ncbi:hypothetical protein Bca52824_037869 [Brassica carinata]|uniref:Uncharacterized protein n=1 Tax=Brassica carinata TaxID=52824 RepID=A0A8X7RN65_BRACI|nr:hypothetical protein Bca52824_037869 [Brassica carinata]